jgi:hypothetical protein
MAKNETNVNGTNQENKSQSGTDKQEINTFDALATAMQDGKMEEVERLMALETPTDKTESTPDPEEKEESAEEEDAEEEEENQETEDSSEDKGESGTETKVDEPEKKSKEAAKTAASPSKDAETLEELKQKLHRAQSDAGRVPYLQRQLEELRREIRATKARSTEDATQGNKASSVKRVEDIKLDPETQQNIDALKEADPVLAATIERTTKAAIFAAQSSVDHAVTTFTDEDQKAEDDRFYVEQKAILIERIPQADAIFATPEWRNWKEQLTPGQKALAESPYANEVEQAIYAFAADMQRYQSANAAATSDTKQKEEVPPVQESEVKQAREKKLNQAAGAKAPAAKKTSELDEQAYFEQMYNEIGKRDHILKS